MGRNLVLLLALLWTSDSCCPFLLLDLGPSVGGWATLFFFTRQHIQHRYSVCCQGGLRTSYSPGGKNSPCKHKVASSSLQSHYSRTLPLSVSHHLRHTQARAMYWSESDLFKLYSRPQIILSPHHPGQKVYVGVCQFSGTEVITIHFTPYGYSTLRWARQNIHQNQYSNP